MKTQVSLQEIARRIAEKRKAKGLSQQELGELIGMQRTSIGKLESGTRSLDVLELKEIARVLEFSLDDFLSEDYALPVLEKESNIVEEEPQIRVSIPQENTKKFETVLLYILEKCAGKPNVGETVLNKLLYFSDFNHYELYEEHLSCATYRKLPHGPVPASMDSILKSMIEEGKITRVNVKYYGYPQKRYLPLEKADLTQLKASEKDVLDKVIDQMSDWSADTISDYSHKDMPWLATKEGDTINYELAFYRETPYSVRNYEEETC